MLNAILILLILHTAYSLIFKPKFNVLACGLFGFCGSQPPSIEKIKILGLYNVSRGGHSCGILLDNVLTKGVDKLKVFDDFIAQNILTTPKNNYTVIGHTRYATVGAHNEANAHPFMINENFVGAHNGGIKNIADLCKKYGVEHTFGTVDSLYLYRLIEANGTDVLTHYTGKAALLWTKLDEPNTLYAFHGASRESSAGEIYEERPMYYLETEEGTYFSSMEESLNAIKENEEQVPEILEYNTVLKFENGRLVGEGVVIKRENKNIPVVAPTPVRNTTAAYNASATGGTNSRVGRPVGMESNVPDENLIEREVRPSRASDSKIIEDFVYFFRGRYFKKDHTMAHGKLRLADKGFIVSEHDPSGKDYYFFGGAMLKSANDYNAINLQKKNDTNSYLNRVLTDNYAYHLSRHTAHPICNMVNIEGVELTPGFQRAWYHDGKRCVKAFTPKFAGRHYLINAHGYLFDIKSTIANEITLEPKKTANQSSLNFNNGGQQAGNPPVLVMPAPKEQGKIIHIDSCSTCEVPRKIDKNDNIAASAVYGVMFASIEEAKTALGKVGFDALVAYIKDYFDDEYESEFKDEDFSREANRIIETAVNSMVSIKDCLAGHVHRIHDYFDMELEKQIDINATNDESPFIDSYHKDAADMLHAMENPEEDVTGENEEEEDENVDESQLIDSACAKLEDFIEYLSKIDAVADRLQENDSDFAQDVAYIIYKQIDVFKHAIVDQLEKCDGTKEIINLLNRKVKNDTV